MELPHLTTELQTETAEIGELPPRAFPLINPREPESLWHVWPEVNPGLIAVNYLGLTKNKGLLSRARAEGIHETLGFDGKIIATVVGENWALDNFDNRTYAEDLDQMGFDFGTTSDDYVYLDDAVLLRRLDPNAGLIGIIQGCTRQQIRFEMTELSRMGLERMALTSADSALRRRYRGIVDFMGVGAEMGIWRWLIGINSLPLMLRFRAEAMSGYAWLYMAAKGYIYRGLVWEKATQEGFCQHPICRSLLWKGLGMTELRARHNVVALTELSEKLNGRTSLE
jgi:hypothetical protein